MNIAKEMMEVQYRQKYADEIIGEYLSVEREAMEHLSSDQWEQRYYIVLQEVFF